MEAVEAWCIHFDGQQLDYFAVLKLPAIVARSSKIANAWMSISWKVKS